jgi:hypothetical protein
MLRGRPVGRAALVLALALWASPAAAQSNFNFGGSCTPGVGSNAADSTGNNWYCNGNTSTVTYPAYWFGSTTSGCAAGTAGLAQFTGSSVSPNNTFEFCNGTSWQTIGGGSSALSGITAATGSASIDSGANAITWAWNSITSGTALSLTSTDMTSGTILEIENTYGGNSTGNMVYLEDVTTGSGAALYVVTTGAYNTGYAGYFTNTSVPANGGQNYGIFVNNSSGSNGSSAIWGQESGTSGQATYGVYGVTYGSGGQAITGFANNGWAGGWFRNTANTGYGLYADMNQSSNTGYTAYFWNAATGTAYGIYSSLTGSGNTGYAGYFSNTSTSGWALYVNGGAQFSATGATCSSTTAGMVQYTSGNRLEYCNGTGWQIMVNPIAGYTSGDWYGVWPSDYGETTYQTYANYIYCMPLTIYQSMHVDSLGTYVHTAGTSSHVELALYGDTGAGWPGSQIGVTSSLATTSAGVLTGTFTSTAVTAGNYWLCAQTDTASAVFDALEGNGGYNSGAVNLMGFSSANNYFANEFSVWYPVLDYNPGSYGTWPASFSGQSWSFTQGMIEMVWHVASIP